MPLRDVGHLVREHAGQFLRFLDAVQQTFEDENPSAGRRSIDSQAGQ